MGSASGMRAKERIDGPKRYTETQRTWKKKTVICVWWDLEEVVYWEILEKKKTVDKESYFVQLHQVNETVF